MDILVISGFLGAGKTTFIKEIIKKTNRDYCILENEYGDINIDSSTLKEEDNSLKIYDLTEGCICCSSKGEFASSMLTISNTLDPDYLIIEPTGVGYLSSILNNLNKVKYDRIRILEAITIVDALFILDNLNVKELDLCLLDQIENASIIVVSKNENLSLEEKEKIKNKLQNFNQKAKIIVDKHYKELDSNFYQDIFLHLLEGNKEKTKEIKTPDLINFSIK